MSEPAFVALSGWFGLLLVFIAALGTGHPWEDSGALLFQGVKDSQAFNLGVQTTSVTWVSVVVSKQPQEFIFFFLQFIFKT